MGEESEVSEMNRAGRKHIFLKRGGGSGLINFPGLGCQVGRGGGRG